MRMQEMVAVSGRYISSCALHMKRFHSVQTLYASVRSTRNYTKPDLDDSSLFPGIGHWVFSICRTSIWEMHTHCKDAATSKGGLLNKLLFLLLSKSAIFLAVWSFSMYNFVIYYLVPAPILLIHNLILLILYIEVSYEQSCKKCFTWWGLRIIPTNELSCPNPI